MKTHIKYFGVSILAAAALVGCGGGGSGGDAPLPATQSIALNGKIIDGYVANAAVCLDLNNDQVCSPGEPAATSQADGSFDLDLAGLTVDQIRQASLLTIVSNASKDADDNGKTIAEAGRSPFRLMAPASVYVDPNGVTKTAVVSPLTSLIAHEMLDNKGISLDDAEALIKSHLNLATISNPFADYIAEPDAALREKARILAITFGEVSRALMAKYGNLSERDADSEAVKFARNNAQKLIADVKGSLTPTGTMTEAVKVALSGYGTELPWVVNPTSGSCSSNFTLNQFNQIIAGMTTAQINAVVGCDGAAVGNTLVYSTNGGALVNTISVTMSNGVYEGLSVPSEMVVQNGVIKGFSENQKTFIGSFRS